MLAKGSGDHVRRVSLDEAFRWWPVSGGKHRPKPRPLPTAPQTEKDPQDPKYDQPKTFGKGWR
jgi:hypothetical protein